MKREIIFTDKDRNKVVAECEIENKNNNLTFSMSGEYQGSMGQCFNDVEPETDEQQELIDLWHMWHLNGMHAGTEEQEKALKSKEFTKWKESLNPYPESDYDCKVLYLKNIAMLVVPHPKTKIPYTYGTAWLTRELPEDFEEDLENLLDSIEEHEEEKRERKVTEEDAELFYSDFSDDKTALALALMLDLCINEIDDIEENNDCRWTVQGVDYLAGTDEEMDEAWDEDLENYIDECLEIPESVGKYFDREAWKEDARVDGRGHSLNRYDGGELYITLQGVDYFAYRN